MCALFQVLWRRLSEQRGLVIRKIFTGVIEDIPSYAE